MEEGGRGEEGEIHLGEMSFQFMTNGADEVGGQNLVYLNILHEYPHNSYFIKLKHDLRRKY